MNVYEQRLRAVLSALQDYLPPGGTSAHDTLTTIIGLVDPWPLPPGESAEAVPSNEKTPPSGSPVSAVSTAAQGATR